MADDDSRKDDAEKRQGSSKPDKDDKSDKPKGKDAKADKSKGKDKSAKDKDGDAKGDKDSDAKGDKDSKAVKTAKKDKESKKGNKPRGPLSRLGLFLREIIEQLRKVVYPTRKQLMIYTLVVLIYVAIMISIVTGLDLGLNRAVGWIFGSPDK